MNIFDIFRKRKEIPAPWSKYYTDDELIINIPNISLYKQLLNTAIKYPNNTAYILTQNGHFCYEKGRYVQHNFATYC